jgi:hypothetical protein
MKIFYTFLIGIVALVANAQAPQGFNYQATVRNNAGALMTNASVQLKFSILQDTATGTLVYSESQTKTTDGLGQVSTVVGQGTALTGTFAAINWGTGTHFLAIELNTGNGFVAMGTTQLLSVPYALYANTAGSTSGSSGGFTHYIGEAFGGGVIFHLWKDAQGVEHGLIVDKTDLSTGQAWSNISQTLIGATAQSSWDGLSNSNAIVGQAGHTNSAAALCLNSTNGGQSDWYLPSIDELSLLWHNRFNVNKSLSAIGGATGLPNAAHYWSSKEGVDYDFAWAFSFFNGSAHDNGTNDTLYVRAVRAF